MSVTTDISAKKIVLCGCHEVGLDLLDDLMRAGLPIRQFVSLTESQARAAQVSGYASFEDAAGTYGIPIHYPKTYALTHDDDVAFFRRENFDLLILGGWQRLIPGEILRTLKIGGLGLHGSSEPLPKGRGRSPINWSLIEGKDKFILHLFLMKDGADDGDILDHDTFDINAWDDCRTLYYKNAVLSKRMLIRNIPKLLRGEMKGVPQQGEPSYYPKRIPEDGVIDWDKSVFEIHNFIRALTKPYPGAFSSLNGERVFFWRAQPFDTRIVYADARVGEIVDVFSTGDYVVKCRAGLLLVTEGTATPKRGQVFGK